MSACMRQAILFVGAVIGAGFVSGREVFSFFSAYGDASWGLILLSAGTMTALCALCLRRAKGTEGCHWCAIYHTEHRAVKRFAQGCILLLQMVMGGSMISAAGHMVALAVPLHGAYLLGIVVTITLALWLGSIDLKPLAMLSGLLTGLYVAAVILVLVFDRGEPTVAFTVPLNTAKVLTGAARSVAYAALNMAISIGVICRCSNGSGQSANRAAFLFGLAMVALLFVSNALYLRHPELQTATFPMVALLARFGRAGYGLSLFTMYLAVLTTLCAGLYAFRTGLETHLSRQTAGWMSALLPLLVSFAGFESLVDRWYAPVGGLCLLLVFCPLIMRSKTKFSLDIW